MKISKTRIKTVCGIAVAALIIGVAALFSYLKAVKDYQEKIKSTMFSDINIQSIPDGGYVGEYDVDFIYAKVEVTVRNGKIVELDLLEHKNDRGQAAEEILHRIIDEQTVDVDVIASATNSSKVIKKAVENALLPAVQ